MLSVLVIDDSSTQRAWLRAVLENQNIRVADCASNEIPSWTDLSEQLSLVMIALRLSTSNGFELGLRLRKSGCGNVVVHSDNIASTDKDWAKAIGLQGVIAIPAPPTSLLQSVHALIECKRPENDLAYSDKLFAA